MTNPALPNPFAEISAAWSAVATMVQSTSLEDINEQITTAQDMLERAFWKAETAEQFSEICLIEAEYLVPLLRQRDALQAEMLSELHSWAGY